MYEDGVGESQKGGYDEAGCGSVGGYEGGSVIGFEGGWECGWV